MSLKTEWPPSPEAMNTLLPAFEFTAKITSSDLGAVFFANQKSLDRQVALKVFSPLLAADPEFRNAFANSCKLAAGLRHSNIIGIFDSGEVGGMLYLVMEFVPGKSLARSTQGYIVEFGQSLMIIDAICNGLGHAHEAGLIHGHLDDLSVLLNQDALPKIGNFGFGRAVHTHLSETTSTHFIAPEVLVSPSAATKTSDVYSVAAIFHGLITGKPYSPEAPAPSTVCDCPPAVDMVIKCATDPDPLKRYPDARAFQAALNQATAKPTLKITGTPVRAAKVVNTSATRVLPKPDSGSIFLVKIAIIIVLLIAIFFAWEMKKKAQTDREKEDLEIITRQKLAKEQAATLQALEQTNHSAPQREQQIPAYTTEKESPLDSLNRLRSALANGKRSEMPVSSVKKGNRTYFFVEKPMQWADAFFFAEQHGAYLADPSADLGWLDFGLTKTKGRSCWLGGARSGGGTWVVSDGKPWSPSSPPEGGGLFLITGENGGFATANADESHPFIIEWRGDGSNPGSLANLLAATRASLAGAAPVFPPGTIFAGERRYLFVKRPVTWAEADVIAKNSGGHLLVTATSEEIADIARITGRIEAQKGIWLGGSLDNSIWQWVTGEPWKTAVWADDSKASKDDVALVLIPRKGWTAMERGDTADGLLIEWSADGKAPKSDSTSPAGINKVAELNAKVKELILAAAKIRENEHAENIKKLHWDLDAYIKSSNRSTKEQFDDSVLELKEIVDDNRLDIKAIRKSIENGEIIASTEMVKLIDYHCKKQVAIAAKAEAGIGIIRNAYVAKITVLKNEAKAAGQIKVFDDLEDAIEDAKNLKSWVESFGAGGD
jgi:serine/threonine protein kinase